MVCRPALQPILLIVASWFGATTLGFAGPLLEAHVTQIINVVNVVQPSRGSHPASLNELIKDELALKTGVKSRSELLFQDNTLTRIGPETYFSFKTGTRDMTLEQGTLLLQVPKGIGGAKIRTAAVTASITGTTIMMEYRPGHDLKVLVLEGSMRLSLNGRLDEKVSLRPGQMIMMPPDARKIPQPVHVDLKQVMSTSSLVKMAKKGKATLPSLSLIQKAIDEQAVEKGNHTLVATNLTIEGQGTNVIVGADSTMAAISRHEDATEAGQSAPTPAPSAPPQSTPVPAASPVVTPNPSATPGSSATPQPSATPNGTATPKPTATPRPSATPRPTATPHDDDDDDDHGHHHHGDDDDGKGGGKKKHHEHTPEQGSGDSGVRDDSAALKNSAQDEPRSSGTESGTKITRSTPANRDRVIHVESSDQLVSLMETSTNSSAGRMRVRVPVLPKPSATNSVSPATPPGAEPTRLPGKNPARDTSITAPMRLTSGLSP
jgi:hypothetical protein